jgi:hypothetical protein
LIALTLNCATTSLWPQDKAPISDQAEETICPNDEKSDNGLATSLTTEWDSKYIFRGVNSLPGSGIATLDAELDYQRDSQHLMLEIWQAAGISKNYDEFDFTLGYKYEKDSFICEKDSLTLFAGYMNYFTPNDDHLHLGYSDTQEIFASVEYDVGSYYTATLKYNYDFDQIRGGFIEPRFAACFPLPDKKTAFDPYVSITYDLQYNSNRFAWNNFQTGIEIVRKINETLKVSATAELSVPLSAIDDFAKKEGWVGLRLTADF